MKTIDVVAAIIRNKDGKFMIAQRNLHKAQGGLWEFPGGKIEAGETKEQAIVREIKEELNMDIVVDGYFAEKVYEYPEKTIRLIALNCFIVGERYQVLEHEAIAWITKDETGEFEFAPADQFFIEKMID